MTGRWRQSQIRGSPNPLINEESKAANACQAKDRVAVYKLMGLGVLRILKGILRQRVGRPDNRAQARNGWIRKQEKGLYLNGLSKS